MEDPACGPALCRRPLAALSFGGTVTRARFWDFVFYLTFGLVVTSSVRIAGVLLVFSYLIVPAVSAMLFAERLWVRLAIGWSMGAIVSAIGIYLSFVWDLPTGATIVTSLGAALILVGDNGTSTLLFIAGAVGFALSGRKGGDLRAQSADTAIGSGRLPDHYSGSVTFEGIPGVIVSARAAHDNWSSLNSLSSSGIQAFDGWDTGAGVEASGPRILQRIVTVRAGARFRTLPFGFNGQKVSEKTFAAGFGAPLTRDRAALDVAIQRASRSAGSDISERGFILSIGLRVSP